MKNQHYKKLLAAVLAATLIFGAACYADGKTQTVSVNYGGTSVSVNGKMLSMTDANNNAVEAINYNGSVYLPIRAIANGLGIKASYEASSKTVALTGTVTTESSSGAPSGTPPTGTPPSGTPPTGTPPSGTPPTGTPPSGTPPTGTPPSGTAGSGTASQSTTAATTVKSKAVTKQIQAVFGGIHVTLNGNAVTLKDSAGNPLEAFNYNGTVYLPVRAVSEALGVTVQYDSTSNTVTLGSGSGAPSGAPGSSGESSVTGTGVLSVTTDVGTQSDKTISATEANQSAVKVSKGGTLTLSNSKITKTGDSTAVETSNFTGLNGGILAEAGAQVTLKNVTINTDAEGSNAVVSTGEGTKVTVDGIKISTTKGSSRGLHGTYGGTIVANQVDIHTLGAHSGALTTDRGEGILTITGGTLLTEGEGSPGIYSTGNITATGVTSTAKGSEAAVIEGKNSITLKDCILSGAKKWGVMIYQSFSGDAGTGTGTFTMTGGSIKAAVGPMFYSTNTNGVINLKGVSLSTASGILIQADGDNQWGTKGSNGAKLAITADSQTLEGSIIADAISEIQLTLKNQSVLTSTVNNAHTAKVMSITLDSGSVWNVTGDSYVTALTDADSTLSNIKDNGHTVYYDASNASNSWLNGKTISLSGGGKLTPAK